MGWPAARWLALAFGVLLVAPTLPSRRLILPLVLSALLYGLAYSVLSVASELRYYLWTMIATALATLVAADDVLTVGGPFMTRRLCLIAGPPLTIAAICIFWRVT